MTGNAHGLVCHVCVPASFVLLRFIRKNSTRRRQGAESTERELGVRNEEWGV